MLFDYLSCIEFDQHSSVGLHLLKRHSQAEVVEQQELQFQMIKLHQWEPTNLTHVRHDSKFCVQSAYLCVSRVGVEYVREEFTCASDTCDYESVDVEAVHYKEMRKIISIRVQVLLGR